jgi:3-isopropylmalate/(R)-2-methylmalate dehydratase small subunit
MVELATRLDAIAAPLDRADIDTGQIFPSRFLRKSRLDGFQNYLFRDARYDAEGRELPDFVLNQEPFRNARILVTGPNFGCGSARESAVHALIDAGFRCVVAASFGDIFYTTCFRNGLLPVRLPDTAVRALLAQLHANPGAHLTIDLNRQEVKATETLEFHFDIEPMRKLRLQYGLDDSALAWEKLDQIRLFEQEYRRKAPWTILP